MNKIEKIKAEIERRKNEYMAQANSFESLGMTEEMNFFAKLASNMAALIRYIDSLEEDPVSNDLEEAAKNYEEDAIFYAARRISDFFKAGAQWQKERDQSTIELAEDHAYLAGQEKIIEKACVWLNNFYSEDRHCYFVEEDIDNFKKAVGE